MNPTLEQVAQLAGVSRSTVSRVINNHPNVRPEVRERVWKAIRECGYRPHAVARSLVTRRTGILGVVIPESLTTLFTDPFFPLLLRGATEVCNLHKHQLMLLLFNDPAGEEEMYQRVLRNGYIDGVIVASATINDPLVGLMARDGIPFVFVGRPLDPSIPSVDVDNLGGARTAVEHLLRLGHRRIATIAGPANMTSAQDRLEGYRQALEAHRIPVDESLIVHGDYTEDGGMLAMQRLLPASPTAVFAASDIMAIGALKFLRQVNLRVPEDIALVGFDDIPAASAVEPRLTTVRQPIAQLGGLAVETLIGLLQGPRARPSVQRIVLPTELVVRESCGALSAFGR
ncbi:MAG: LacI family DNA-binding transcriptional regulator [Chloroflexia bacterium]